jgi:hypothetical protein
MSDKFPLLYISVPLSYSQVLAHPQYQANPIAAITNHLATTLPPPPELPKPVPDPVLRKQQKARRKWEKKLQQGNDRQEMMMT